MKPAKITRKLNAEERETLRKLKYVIASTLKPGAWFFYFPAAAVIGAISFYLANISTYAFFRIAFGCISLFCFSFIVFMPFELYRSVKTARKRIKAIEEYLRKDSVTVIAIKASAIAFARAYEDTGDLYMVEYDHGQVIYLWDNERSLGKKFPCLHFEIYEEGFYKVLGRRILCLSEPVEPVIIDEKIRWGYMREFGAPENMETAEMGIEELVQRFSILK